MECGIWYSAGLRNPPWHAAMMQAMDILELAKAALALFAIVDPVGVIPMFLLATQGYTLAQSHAAARIAALTVLGVLTLFAFLGEPLLMFFGIRLAAFAVAGGLLLLLLALSMVQARVSPQRQTQDEAAEAEEREAVGVVPLGIPLLAGPGAITHVIAAAWKNRDSCRYTPDGTDHRGNFCRDDRGRAWLVVPRPVDLIGCVVHRQGAQFGNLFFIQASYHAIALAFMPFRVRLMRHASHQLE